MCPEHPSAPEAAAPEPARRRFLAGVITTVQGAIGATLGVLLGGAVAAPALGRRSATWWPAGSLDDLQTGDPTPVTIRVTREDGYRQVVDRQVVFLVRDEGGAVRAMSSECTHLGCRVSWDAADGALKCPCHGGAFDRTGAVTAGPPPAPLETLATRVEGDQILVQL